MRAVDCLRRRGYFSVLVDEPDGCTVLLIGVVVVEQDVSVADGEGSNNVSRAESNRCFVALFLVGYDPNNAGFPPAEHAQCTLGHGGNPTEVVDFEGTTQRFDGGCFLDPVGRVVRVRTIGVRDISHCISPRLRRPSGKTASRYLQRDVHIVHYLC